jgi:hypothetical protein
MRSARRDLAAVSVAAERAARALSRVAERIGGMALFRGAQLRGRIDMAKQAASNLRGRAQEARELCSGELEVQAQYSGTPTSAREAGKRRRRVFGRKS